MLNLSELEAFVAFAERLNFTHAARAMHLSQPALHARITRLGDSLGVPLYLRRGRRLELTAEGEELARFGRDILGRCEAFEARLAGEAIERPVAVVAGEGAWLHLLGPAVAAYQRDAQRPLRVLTAGGEATLELLRAGRARLGVTAVDHIERDELESQLLSEVPMAVALPQTHPLASQARLSLDPLVDEAMVVPPLERPHRRHLEAAFERLQAPLRVAVEASGWALMLHFVSLGLGLAVVNGCVRPPAGVVLRPLDDLPPRRYHIVARSFAALEGDEARMVSLMHQHANAWSA